MDIILERDFDVIGVSECDIQDFDPKWPFKWTGYRTFFLMEREGCDKKRLLCFVKSTIKAKERTDLMSDIKCVDRNSRQAPKNSHLHSL